MDKPTKIVFGIWAVMAVALFISAFWAPVVIAIINWIFGGLNILILGSLGLTQIQTIAEVNKVKKQVEDELQLQTESIQPVPGKEKGNTRKSPAQKGTRKK